MFGSYRIRTHLASALVASCLVCCMAGAKAGVFDFEDLPATWDPNSSAGTRSGSLKSLSLTDSDGCTLTLVREGSTGFDITSNTVSQSGKPEAWGLRSLDPAFNQGAFAFIGTFGSPVDGVSVEFGDYGQDADTVSLTAYNGPGATGDVIAGATDEYDLASFPVAHAVSVSGPGIRSFRLIGGSPDGPQSVFYDNITVRCGAAAIPEPGTLALLAAMLPLALAARRRS